MQIARAQTYIFERLVIVAPGTCSNDGSRVAGEWRVWCRGALASPVNSAAARTFKTAQRNTNKYVRGLPIFHSLLSFERQILILEASQPNMRFCVKNEESTAYVMRAYICLRATDVCFDVRGIRLYRVGELFNRSKNVQYKD